MKLESISKISGTMRVLSGLHIGAGKDSVEIGGLDQPIIKHPISGAPYVPGSSIKGKMRSLLEIYYFSANLATREALGRGKPCDCGKAACPACRIFGSGADPKKVEDDLGPTRLIVRDATLAPLYAERFNKGELPMEVKYENIIHRVKGVAEHPRPLERVPAGVEFSFSMSFKKFEGDQDDLLAYVYKGLRLIELDALGGCGSRGCGQVEFLDLRCDDQPVNLDDYPLK